MEVQLDDGAKVRDGKLGEDSPVLTFDRDAWRSFVRGIKQA